MQDGLYKVDFHTVHGTGSGETISARVSTQRRNDDPSFRPLFGTDRITLTLKGTACGDMVDFEGSALQLPGVHLKAVLTLISDQKNRTSRGTRSP